MTIHLLKQAAGIADISQLAARQADRIYTDDDGRQVVDVFTRNRPRRDAELLDGGSLYWIIRHKIRCRQPILDLQIHDDEDGRPFCLIRLDASIVPTLLRDQRPFQGWRYLDPDRVPPDRPKADIATQDMPEKMVEELRALGLL